MKYSELCIVNLANRWHWLDFSNSIRFSIIHLPTSTLTDIHHELSDQTEQLAHCYSRYTNPQAKLTTCKKYCTFGSVKIFIKRVIMLSNRNLPSLGAFIS